MAKIVPVSSERYGAKRWSRPPSYSFAATQAAIPLVGQELGRAALTLPIAFLKEGDADSFMPVALTGLAPGRNLFVLPDGTWAPDAYVPAVVRGYPFRLAKAQEKRVLCIDEESGLVGDGPAGELFYGDDGNPSPALKRLFDFLAQVENGRLGTERVCATLAKHGLIKPWPVKLRLKESERSLEGLHRIDEATLNALPDEAFLELRRDGALIVAYCQLISMQNLGRLGELARGLVKAAQQASTEPDLSVLDQGGKIGFEGLH